MQSNRKVILLVAEAVTLAHYGRIATLSRTLPTSDYHVIVAADPRYRALDEIPGTDFYPIWSVPSSQFSQALEQGRPLYDVKTLMRYVEEDLALIDAVKPDLIVGDFRLSLAVSAPLRKVPYASIVNAYWSPYADIAYPVPDLPVTRILGVRMAQKLFNAVRPMAFALHARPLNRVRRRYGLPPMGLDLRNVYTWGEYTLYADIPEVVPTSTLPERHRYLGPVLWSTHTPMPDWWSSVPQDKPIVFLTLGSSGQAYLLPMALIALSQLPVTVIAATAGKIVPSDAPANAYIANYLPMDIATQRAQLVICNGGSLTTYQALASGVPVIGLPTNLDQYLNTSLIVRQGAGLLVRGGEASPEMIRMAVLSALNEPRFTQAAQRLRADMVRYPAEHRFRATIEEICAQTHG